MMYSYWNDKLSRSSIKTLPQVHLINADRY